MKELEQNKEELRKMKESFHSKVEELEKENSWTSKVIPSEEVRVIFFKCIKFINPTECCKKSVWKFGRGWRSLGLQVCANDIMWYDLLPIIIVNP